MKTTRRHELLIFLTLLLSGCAASAIVDDDDAGLPLADETDDSGSPNEVSTPPVRDASVKDAGGTKVTQAPPPDAGSPTIADASTTPHPDASTAPRSDAAVAPPHPDTGVPSVPVVDAAVPVTPVDAGTKPPGMPPPDAAVPTNPNTGVSCTKDSDCTQSCLPIGVATCCTFANTCGCTWTPGIYCL